MPVISGIVSGLHGNFSTQYQEDLEWGVGGGGEGRREGRTFIYTLHLFFKDNCLTKYFFLPDFTVKVNLCSSNLILNSEETRRYTPPNCYQ